jgi:tRNA threonylcarbamoyladenosine biosynthesis protein TsaE
MARPSNRPVVVEFALADLAATASLARALAERARPGDVIGLAGDLGTGKTTFARAFIHAMAELTGGTPEEVPSPTFTLVQVYDFPGISVWHVDLYRVERPEDAYELGIEEAFASAVSLIEWPERLGPLLPESWLELRLAMGEGVEERRARLSAFGEWAGRLEGLDRRE